MRVVYLLKNHKIIFIFNAKCASTTIKNVICQIDNISTDENDYFDAHRKLQPLVRERDKNNITIDEALTTYKDYPVVFFKRNPYDRFVSGYTKVSQTAKLILKIKFIRNKTLKECNKLVNYGDISFSDFADLITSADPKHLDVHYIPQTHGTEKIFQHDNLYLYDIKDLNDFNSYLNDNFNLDVKLNIRGGKRYNWVGRKKEKVPKRLKENLYKYYKNDFDLLGYEK